MLFTWGMGEPFDNLENVLKSLEILTSDWGYGWSPKRITVSTIGIIPAMQQFLEKSNVHLAVSLHSPFEEDRKKNHAHRKCLFFARFNQSYPQF